MNLYSKSRLIRFVICAAIALAIAGQGLAAVAPHGPTFPPDPWDGIAAHGPTFPPDPWDGKLAHGPTFPPDPWDGAI